MFKILALLGLALVSPTCFAASVFNVPSSFCSGTQSSSLNSPLSLNCSGNLTLSGGVLGGVLTDSAGINLSTTGTLTLDNLTITAPQIQFTAGSLISMNGVSIAGANAISLTAGTTTSFFNPASFFCCGMVNVPPNLAFNRFTLSSSIPPVPEPGIYATMLIGLLFLVGLLRTSRYRSHFAGWQAE